MNEDMESTRAERFTWFDAETVAELCAQLNAAGPGARLEIHRVPRGGEHKTWLHVVGGDGERAAFQPLNKSWECPPICP